MVGGEGGISIHRNLMMKRFLCLTLLQLQLAGEGKIADIGTRVRPFRLKNFFADERNKAKLDPFHMCFTISL
jgi:hypothetical protein